ncbi:hypothetical protein RF11_11115 [Thelohanellus kitauei]|uniref:Gamma-tubulin complex component n=1 Tax=Thelohanellus kitauei TaxID=669202 RepID=A0A0C2IVS3_THEKT|nr:hypothetical protein RF11_11115 [Thelohanellus kitauei]
MKSYLSKTRNFSQLKLLGRSSLHNTLKRSVSIRTTDTENYDLVSEPCDEFINATSMENIYQTRRPLTSFLASATPRVQELLATEDLLYVLLVRLFINRGIQRPFYHIFNFELADITDGPCSFQDPKIFGKYLISFIHNFRRVLEFLAFVAEIELMFRKVQIFNNQGEINLQKLLYLKESCINELDFVASICSEELKDSHEILSHLHRKLELSMNSGICADTCNYIMSTVSYFSFQASKPYFDMIAEWIYYGVIKDPGNEVEEKILNAGKYLNVLRQCGICAVNQEGK